MIDYSSKDFEEVVAFSVSEPGAMGPNDIGFFMKDGRNFRLDYKTEETPWSDIREWFPTLQKCYFDGPMRDEIASLFTVIIGASENDKETHVAPGWRHKYLDYGNHLVIKETYYREIMSLIGSNENIDLTFGWEKLLSNTDFVDRLDEIQEDFQKQKEEDEKLTATLTELKKNPEYVKRVKDCSGDVDAMTAVLKEFTGIDMDWVQLKQFGFRQQGLI